ncbi:hypothetical protein D3C71_1375060 [compost metagenome]
MAHALGECRGACQRRRCHHHGEFLTPITGNQIGAAHRAAGQRCSDQAQALVTGRVTVPVIEVLEAVDIHHQQCDALPAAPRPLPRVTQALVELPAVGQAGEAVDPRQRIELVLARERMHLHQHAAQARAQRGQHEPRDGQVRMVTDHQGRHHHQRQRQDQRAARTHGHHQCARYAHVAASGRPQRHDRQQQERDIDQQIDQATVAALRLDMIDVRGNAQVYPGERA